VSQNKDEARQRAAVVAEARSWIGTRYHNCADIKGAGADCGMLLVRVFVDTGLVAPFDPRPYPPDWHLHRSEEKYLGFVFDRTHEVFLTDPLPNPPPQAGEAMRAGEKIRGGAACASLPRLRGRDGEGVKPGDVAVFRFGRCYSHGGIVVETRPLTIVHAYAPAGCVLEERVQQSAVLSEPIRKPRFFSLWSRSTTIKRRANGLEGGMSAPRET
jgi:cell wall-associated NlpC family hydrolase